jgi:hypothetical protein
MMNQESIDREIGLLYKAMNIHAACGNAEDVNRIRDLIAHMERQKQLVREGQANTGEGK